VLNEQRREINKMRWHAVVYYRTEAESDVVDIEHDFEEVGAFEEAIEKGPSFAAIDRIVITYTGSAPAVTLEQAQREDCQ
jgi:hypothetical protein